MKNYFNYYRATDGENVFICTDNDEVKEGKIIDQDITICDENKCLVALTIETEDKERHNMSARLCYASIDDYRANKPIQLDEGHFCRIKGISDSGDKPMYYTIENGQVVMNVVEIKHIHIDCQGIWKYTSPEVPTDIPMYTNPEIAEQMCRTEWTDEQGGKHVKDGLISLVLLDDEQKAALKAFEDVMARFHELKIGIGFHTDSNRIWVWNNRKVEYACFSYDKPDDGGEEAHIPDPEVCDNFLTDIYLDYIGYDDIFYVKRKDEDEQKKEE